ncbi:MAG: imidazole glycerol phosphate synthase subunit HisH [Gammaproteobacteria bacterium]|nr:imidazole glycerol phosphate synthase subunit HisH [Gammaproteobacteria bacterium]
MGNLHSVAKALEHSSDRLKVIVSSDRQQILAADRVVLPGVGAIRDCLGEMRRLELIATIIEVAQNKPFLGVCVGMQALMSESEENGGTQALNLFPGKVRRFSQPLQDARGTLLKVPHMGWNQVEQCDLQHPLWAGIANASRFYFVHSYYVEPQQQSTIAATATHGVTFAAAISRGNLFATQFHPEKSQKAGLQLYRNFLQWDGTLA